MAKARKCDRCGVYYDPDVMTTLRSKYEIYNNHIEPINHFDDKCRWILGEGIVNALIEYSNLYTFGNLLDLQLYGLPVEIDHENRERISLVIEI